MAERRHTLAELIGVIARFRDPKRGCPWDLQQDCHSIVPHTLEEVAELVDAIDAQDYDNIREELGDVLLQVVFYTRFAEEAGRFDFDDVVHDLVLKLVRRHPHIYPDGRLDDSVEPPASQAAVGADGSSTLDAAGVRERWEQIKRSERGDAGKVKGEDGMPLELAALRRAWKLQKIWSRRGWQSPNRDAAAAELRRALEALESGVESPDQVLGELLFNAVHLARLLEVEPERALRAACVRFVSD